MLGEVVYPKLRPHLRSAIIGCAALILAAAIGWLGFGNACANWSQVALLQFYFRGRSLDHAIPYVCASPASDSPDRQRWSQGVVTYLRGDRQYAEPLLTTTLATAPTIERTYRIDQLLSFATLVSRNESTKSDFVVDLAQRYQHNSPIGYMRLAQIYINQTRAGNTTNWERVRTLTRLSGQTHQVGFAPMLWRAQAWFYLGEFSRGIATNEAIAAYRAVISEDPQNQSHSYTSDSARKLAEIYISQQQFDAARDMLNVAASLPSLPYNYSQTRIQLAQMERSQRGTSVAITILEETIAHEADYIPTHLYLASLYSDEGRCMDAIGQYQAILSLDPGHIEARAALVKLEGQQ